MTSPDETISNRLRQAASFIREITSLEVFSEWEEDKERAEAIIAACIEGADLIESADNRIAEMERYMGNRCARCGSIRGWVADDGVRSTGDGVSFCMNCGGKRPW